jgi:hypothetical protein
MPILASLLTLVHVANYDVSGSRLTKDADGVSPTLNGGREGGGLVENNWWHHRHDMAYTLYVLDPWEERLLKYSYLGFAFQ